jgi:hypothetical protein
MFSSFGEGQHTRYTQSKDGNTKYIFFFDFPQSKLLLKKISFLKGQKIKMLGSNKYLAWKQTEEGVEISIPAGLKPVSDYVWVLKVKN